MNATHLPSGLNATSPTPSRMVASVRVSPGAAMGSACSVLSPFFGLRREVNASVVPSGLQVGLPSWSPPVTARGASLHVDDMAAASVHVMNLDPALYQANTQPMLSHINVGSGVDCTIRELAETVARITGFQGRLGFDATKPDGTPRKLMEVSRLRSLGWQAL